MIFNGSYIVKDRNGNCTVWTPPEFESEYEKVDNDHAESRKILENKLKELMKEPFIINKDFNKERWLLPCKEGLDWVIITIEKAGF